MRRLQDLHVLPDYLQGAGMPSIHGGLAGVGQIDPTLFQDPQIAADVVSTDPSITTLFQDPQVAADGYVVNPTAPAQAAIPTGATIDTSTGELTVDGFTYSLPGGAAPGIDPGWRDGGQAGWYWLYASGDKSYNTGVYVWADGTYQTADGYQIKPGAAGYTMAPDGTVTWATAAKPAPVASQASGASGASIFGFLKGLLSVFTGPTAPPGTMAGQTFRSPNGQYYRLNADGSTSAVASPYGGFGAGLSGLTSSPLLLVGLAAAAYFIFAGRKKG